MSQPVESHKLSVGEFAQHFGDQLVPLSNRFTYFFTALPLTEEDIKEYLEEPIKSLPATLCSRLPETALVLAPWMERAETGADPDVPATDYICFKEPAAKKRVSSSTLLSKDRAMLVFAVRDIDVAEYHYLLFNALARLTVDVVGDELHDQFSGILGDELSASVHGEVDEESWELKQALLRRQRDLRRKTKGLIRYARQSLIDTLTLYLHGICCDIDVETSPRQLASRYLRRRLELLQSIFPPPDGYLVFPEDSNHGDAASKGAARREHS